MPRPKRFVNRPLTDAEMDFLYARAEREEREQREQDAEDEARRVAKEKYKKWEAQQQAQREAAAGRKGEWMIQRSHQAQSLYFVVDKVPHPRTTAKWVFQPEYVLIQKLTIEAADQRFREDEAISLRNLEFSQARSLRARHGAGDAGRAGVPAGGRRAAHAHRIHRRDGRAVARRDRCDYGRLRRGTMK